MTFYSENISLPPSETCFNCMKSNDGDSVKLSRCSKCKIAFYCSTLCMKEHWYKVHGKHCKYLAGDEKMVGADHEEKKCKVCKDMSRKPHKYRATVVQCPFKIKKDSLFKNATKTISRVLLHQLQNGWDITVLEDEFVNQPANFLVNLPFQLGELSGNYVDKVDKALGHMFTLAASINLDNCEVTNWFLDSDLIKVRTYYWSSLLSRNSDFFLSWFSSVNPLWASLALINEYIQKQETPSKLWALFVLKYNYIQTLYFVNVQKDMAHVGHKTDFVERTKQVLMAFEEFDIFNVHDDDKIWRDVNQVTNLICRAATHLSLDSLSLSDSAKDSPLPLVGCSSCSVKFSTDDAQLRPDVYLYKNLEKASLSWKGPSIIIHKPSFLPVFYCGDIGCKESVKELYNQENVRSELSSNDCIGFFCEYCQRLTLKPHRCSACNSKLYCSAECKDDDWKMVHRKMCKMYVKDGTKMTFDTKMRKSILFEMQSEQDFK